MEIRIRWWQWQCWWQGCWSPHCHGPDLGQIRARSVASCVEQPCVAASPCPPFFKYSWFLRLLFKLLFWEHIFLSRCICCIFKKQQGNHIIKLKSTHSPLRVFLRTCPHPPVAHCQVNSVPTCFCASVGSDCWGLFVAAASIPCDFVSHSYAHNKWLSGGVCDVPFCFQCWLCGVSIF